jgi:hypothetical protein
MLFILKCIQNYTTIWRRQPPLILAAQPLGIIYLKIKTLGPRVFCNFIWTDLSPKNFYFLFPYHESVAETYLIHYLWVLFYESILYPFNFFVNNFPTNLAAIAHNVPVVCDVFLRPMRETRRVSRAQKNVGVGWRGNERSE